MNTPEQEAFARFLDAAAPYLDGIVVAGGWASRLYQLSEHANETECLPLRTKDVDAVLPSPPSNGPEKLGNRLSERGFVEQPSSDFVPPVTKYVLGKRDGFEVEFITDLPGGLMKRDGTHDATIAIGDVTAQRLHYVRLLLIDPWSVTLDKDNGFPVTAGSAVVRIPNPVSCRAAPRGCQPGCPPDGWPSDLSTATATNLEASRLSGRVASACGCDGDARTQRAGAGAGGQDT